MSASNYERALREVLRHEGGYVDHPSDPGGATNMGITQRTLAAWRKTRVAKSDVRSLTHEEAASIYRAQYWAKVRADELPAGLDLAVFDLAVNSGPDRAIRMMQMVAGVALDGRIGPITLRAVTDQSGAELVEKLCDARLHFLSGLPTYPIFGRGWRRRVEEVRTLARRMALMAPPILQKAAAPASSPDNPKPSSSKQQENTTMELTKSFLTSKTVWANIIGFGALVLSIFGFNTSAIDPNAFAEHILQAIAAGSFVISTLFRVIATKKIG